MEIGSSWPITKQIRTSCEDVAEFKPLSALQVAPGIIFAFMAEIRDATDDSAPFPPLPDPSSHIVCHWLW